MALAGKGRMNSNRPQCQLCGRVGHGAMTCYYRFDHNYYSYASFSSSGMNGGQMQSHGASNGGQMQAHQTNFGAHNVSCPQSYMMSPEVFTNPSWFVDLGATNHCTPDLENLQFKTGYNGKEQVHVGNGAGLSINSIGKTHFNPNAHAFFLNDILHTPLITKNLLSVFSFTKDNNCYFEFFPNFCYVKDQVTKKILLHGSLKNGLYAFHLPLKSSNSNNSVIKDSSSQLSVFHANLSQVSDFEKCNVLSHTVDNKDLNLWHKRLGHPSLSTVNSIINKCNIPYTASFLPCEACPLGKSHVLPFSTSLTICTIPLQLVQADV